ncbi:MAG: HD domain-containing protein [Chitinophagales bacterium]
MSKSTAIVSKTTNYIETLFNNNLPIHLVYHSLEHTQNVAKGVDKLCEHIPLTKEEKLIVRLAAWFHDSGHIIVYKGHEAVSQAIAYKFLRDLDVKIDVIQQVIDCIEATKMPQKPQNLLQQIVCDADLYHLSFADYDDYEYLLRVEWELILNKTYTDEEWRNLNIQFLTNHEYFTPYAQKVWRKRKDLNLKILREQRGKKVRQT